MILRRWSRTAGSAALNMAQDHALLDVLDRETVLLAFRAYGWQTQAFTFGYTQSLEAVQRKVPAGDWDLCRRPSGGGVVDHRNDWTYALAVSPAHPWAKLPPLEAYRILHAMLSDALNHHGAQSGLWVPENNPASSPFACFDSPSPFDVVQADRPMEKLAGAALKRCRQGLLFQGSVRADTLPPSAWPDCETLLVGKFAQALGTRLCIQNAASDLPFAPHLEHYLDPRWNHRRA
jgi:lipoate-protein ligase A